MNVEDSFKLIDIMFRDNPSLIVNHHLQSYNKFYNKDIREIIKDNNPIKFITELDEETGKYRYSADMYVGGKDGSKIYYGKPIIYDSNDDESRIHYMMPNEARLRNMTYAFPIHYDLDIEFKILLNNNEGKGGTDKYEQHEMSHTIENIFLGKFPIMLKSDMCLLSKLDKNVCYNLGECKNDPGGYFIIDGKEKAIVSQENRADNILYIRDKFNEIYSHVAEIRSVSEDASKPIRTLSVRIMSDQPGQSYGNIVVMVPNIRKPVPLFILMRALGVISDKEIITTCLLDLKKYDFLMEHFIPSVYDAGNLFTQHSALSYLATLTKGKTISHVLDILMNYFIPHIGEMNFKHKSLYLGYIVKRLLLVYTGVEKPTNRDKYSQKRIENTGTLLSQLFVEFYKKQISNIFLKIDQEYHYKGSDASSYQDLEFPDLIIKNKELIFNERLVEEGFSKAFKGNWGGEAHTKRAGIVQQLNRLSFFSFICQLRKTNLNIGDGTKMIEPRLLNATQYGYLCPIHSPDGGNVGLHKHISTSSIITNGVSAKPFISYLKSLGVKLLEECSYDIISESTKIFINGAWIGITTNPIELTKTIRLHRRNNVIYEHTSVLFDIKRNEIQLWVDSGRISRPLFYIENKQPSYMKENIMKKIQDKSITWNELTKGTNPALNSRENVVIEDITKINTDTLSSTAGIIDYVDASEAESMLLMKTTTEVEEIKYETHAEIHESLILGFMANQIIFPENNPYPRNAFSCGQSKQGVSLYNMNYLNRIDKSGLILNTGQLPLTKSRYLKYITNEEHNYGSNAIVAIMCYSGYNVEDAVIINGGSIKRGLFGTTYYNMYEDYERTSKIGNSNVDTQFMNIENNNVLGLKEGYDYSKLDEETGLIKENTEVNEKTIMIGKTTTSMLEDNYYIDSSVKAKKGQTGVVDKSFITDGEVGQRIAKVRIRAQRIPKIGDKFCSRAGQKGTIGLILPEEDMPTTADGIKPDIIVNPHAMPSRMTIGHLVETLSSKMAALLGGFADCTAFVNKGPRHKIFGDILRNNGYHSSGNEVLYNGMTGEQLETEIYFGPTFYLRLKHMPKDKVNYRARGPRTVLTRQTVGGRANDGGLRIGEMDRDCLVAHGMTNFIKESMMVRGDQYYMAVCNNTGTIAVYNESKNLFLSPHVDGPLKYNGDVLGQQNVVQHTRFGKNFSVIKVPYAFKLLMQELKSMNVQMRIITEDNIDKLTNLYYGDNHVDINSVDKLDKDFSEQEEIQEFNRKNSIIYGPNITIAESNKRLQSYGFDVNFNAVEQASPTDDEKKLLESYNDKEYIPKDVILELGLDRELSEGLYQGAVVRLRDENNNISRKEYRIIGINEAYNEYHLKDNNPNVEGGVKKVTKEMIYYKYAPDLPDKNLKIGDDFTGTITSNIQELQDIEPIKQLEPIQEVTNETKGEIDIDNIADFYDSPEAAYAPTSPQAYYKPTSPDEEFYELSPDKRGGGELLDEEEFYDEEDDEDDEDDVEENNETRTSTVLNNDTVQLRYLGNIEEDKNDDDSENENNDNNQIKKI